MSPGRSKFSGAWIAVLLPPCITLTKAWGEEEKFPFQIISVGTAETCIFCLFVRWLVVFCFFFRFVFKHGAKLTDIANALDLCSYLHCFSDMIVAFARTYFLFFCLAPTCSFLLKT